jgi:hypothetical protein
MGPHWYNGFEGLNLANFFQRRSDLPAIFRQNSFTIKEIQAMKNSAPRRLDCDPRKFL